VLAEVMDDHGDRRVAVALLLAADQQARRGRVPGHRSSEAKVPDPRERRSDDSFATAPPQQNGTAHLTEGIAMNAVKTWTVQVEIDEHEDSTRAVARLDAGGAQSLTGTGLARLHPVDRDVPSIGDELAAARALSELSHLLLDVAARDIEQSSGVPAHPVL
jgi:hypothetical protein